MKIVSYQKSPGQSPDHPGVCAATVIAAPTYINETHKVSQKTLPSASLPSGGAMPAISITLVAITISSMKVSLAKSLFCSFLFIIMLLPLARIFHYP